MVAKYDRRSGKRLAVSTGEAKHLNSGFLNKGKLYCAHSNYPQTPELSEIKVLNVESMQLSTFKGFGNFGGSLTWAVLQDDHWWCNFARYGAGNTGTLLVKFDAEWEDAGHIPRRSFVNWDNIACRGASGRTENCSSPDTMIQSFFASVYPARGRCWS